MQNTHNEVTKKFLSDLEKIRLMYQAQVNRANPKTQKLVDTIVALIKAVDDGDKAKARKLNEELPLNVYVHMSKAVDQYFAL